MELGFDVNVLGLGYVTGDVVRSSSISCWRCGGCGLVVQLRFQT